VINEQKRWRREHKPYLLAKTRRAGFSRPLGSLEGIICQRGRKGLETFMMKSSQHLVMCVLWPVK